MIVAGIGCSGRATLPELRALLVEVAQGCIPGMIACLEGRAAQIGPLALEMGLPLVALPRDALRGVATPSQSDRIMAGFGTGSVAEACAILGAGHGARIICARHLSPIGQATCALAEGTGR